MDKELFSACYKKWGANSQVLMAIEEMGELSQALARFLNNRDNNVNEEIADVLLMVNQLKWLFDSDKIDRIIEEKTERIWKRIGNVRET